MVRLKLALTAALAALLLMPLSSAGQDWLDREVEAYKESDRLNGTPTGVVLFLGSSSFRLWDNLTESFPKSNVLNRGFGGSSLRHAIYYFNELVRPYKPTQIILYFGDNDLSDDSYSVDTYMSDVKCFVRMVQLILPGTDMCYVSTKPSPSRRAYFAKYTEANRRVKEFCERTDGLTFIDIWTPMADGNNRLYNNSTFISDSLHLSPAGYKLWTEIITPYLKTE